MATATGRIGQIPGEVEQVMDELTLIELAFLSLAIDLNGDPLLGVPTWVKWVERMTQNGQKSERKPAVG